MAFVRWLKAVGKHWWAVVTGGAIVLLLALYSEVAGVTIAPRIYEAVGVAAIFQAMFLAWHEQERRWSSAQRDLTALQDSIQYALRLIDFEIKYFVSPESRIDIQVGLVLQNNHPNLAIRYDVERFSVTVSGQSVIDPRFLVKTAVIPVGGKEIFRFPTIVDVSFEDVPTAGAVSYSIQYGAAHSSLKYKTTRELRILFFKASIFDQTPTRVEWQSVSESDHL